MPFLLLFGTAAFAQTASRIISSSDTFVNSTQIWDTTIYYYSTPTDVFDSTITKQVFGNSPDTGYLLHKRVFDGNRNILEDGNYQLNNGSWEGVDRTLMTYDASNRKVVAIAQFFLAAQWFNMRKDSLGYDSNNNVSVDYQFNWNNGAFQPTNRINYTYDANNNVLSAYTNTYDGISWQYSNRWVYSYTANNALLTGTYAEYGANWITKSADTSEYTGNLLTRKFHYETWANGDYFLQNVDSALYNANNKLIQLFSAYNTHPYWNSYSYDSLIYDQNWVYRRVKTRVSTQNPWSDLGLRRNQYNTSQQLVYTDTFANYGTGQWEIPQVGAATFRSRYYYENYTTNTTPTSVATTTVNKIALALSPNPAASFITIDIVYDVPEKTEVVIYNMNGVLMMRWYDAAGASLHRMVPLQSFSSGNYILQVKGKNTAASQVFTVVK
ncbi:T9SS type A sorting domain-containing protein [Taibaiella soli]|nr:T9SS type A sorting domain-containing protein [Taibaiella soli]